MANDRIICYCRNVTYLDIRKAMIKGARTLDEIKKMTGAGTVCGACIEDIEKILSSVCGCRNISLDTVVTAVKDGCDTVEKVGENTGAGVICGRCKPLIQNIIDLRK